jgi:hypothetical protein
MSYRIDVAADLIQRLRDLKAEAQVAGQADRFAEGVRSIHFRLVNGPHSAGEIQYRTGLGDPVHVVASGPVAFNFVIHDATSVVWVIKIERLLARHE